MRSLSIPVAVLLECTKVEANVWIDDKWQAVGVIPTVRNSTPKKTKLTNNPDGRDVYRYDGFVLEFERDELDSYYQNLVADKASVFVICRPDEDGYPQPFLATLSYDEAAIYMETDEIVYTVGIHIEIYKKIENFVLKHYQPAPRKKRKLVKGSAGKHYQG